MGMSYKYYSVLASQVGTAAPTVKDLDSTLDKLVWARTGTGTYTITKTGAFKENKTLPVKDAYTDIDGNYMTLERTSWDVMTLKTYAAADTSVLADDVLDNQFIHIEVYI